MFFVHAHRAVAASDDAALRAVAELAAAFAPSKERHLETTAQGRAFLDATRAAWPCARSTPGGGWDGAVAYPVAVGVARAGHGIALEPALHAYLHAVAANLISAGVRLVPLGQTDGQRVLAALEPVIAATAARALAHAARRGRRRGLPRRHRQHAARERSTHGCSRSVMMNDEPVPRSAARRRRRPGRLRQDRADGRAVQALRDRYEIAAITNDIYTKWDAEYLVRSGALAPERIAGVETGGCPHTAIREDASINLAAVAEMRAEVSRRSTWS